MLQQELNSYMQTVKSKVLPATDVEELRSIVLT